MRNSISNQLFRKSLTISQKRGLRASACAKFSAFSGNCLQTLNSMLSEDAAEQALSPYFGLITGKTGIFAQSPLPSPLY